MTSESATIVQLFHELHAGLREAVQGQDSAVLNWVPAEETNSIAVLIVHLLGSELETVRMVRGLPSDRDRLSEFKVANLSADDLVGRIDAADAALDEAGSGLTADNLTATVKHPRRGTEQSGLYWLVSNYGHANEHLAHLQLTKQFYKTQVLKEAGPA